MSRTFDVNVVLTGKIVMSEAGVADYVRATKAAAADGSLDKFGDTLLEKINAGDVDGALAQLIKQCIREGIRDFSNQIDRELKQDDSRFKAAPATVAITPQININRPAGNDED